MLHKRRRNERQQKQWWYNSVRGDSDDLRVEARKKRRSGSFAGGRVQTQSKFVAARDFLLCLEQAVHAVVTWE